MKIKAQDFLKEAKIFLRVYMVTFQAIAIFYLVFQIFLWANQQKVVLVGSSDVVLKTPVAEASR